MSTKSPDDVTSKFFVVLSDKGICISLDPCPAGPSNSMGMSVDIPKQLFLQGLRQRYAGAYDKSMRQLPSCQDGICGDYNDLGPNI